MKIIPTLLEWNPASYGMRFSAFVPMEELAKEGPNRIDIGKELHLSDYDFPEKAVLKCEHCGQWAAKYTACKSCGAPVG